MTVEALDTEHPILTIQGPGRLSVWVRVREGAEGWTWADLAQNVGQAARDAAAALWPDGTPALLEFEEADVGESAPAGGSSPTLPGLPPILPQPGQPGTGGFAEAARVVFVGLALLATVGLALAAVWRAGEGT